jgi:hypothetical protein
MIPDVVLTAQDHLVWIEELRQCEGYQKFVVPEIERRLKEHRDACCNPSLSWEKRAEHLQAVASFQALTTFLETSERTARETLKRVSQMRAQRDDV